jgi:uncharacterized LabA/DUF88 family protein
MSDKATVLVDGGYFDYVNDYCRDEYDEAVDLHDFADKLARAFGCNLLRCNFYHAFPYIDDDEPTDHQIERRQSAQSFFDTLDGKPKCQFEEKGRVKKERQNCPDCSSSFTSPTQKGVDVGIAVDLVKMASDRNSPDAFILVSGDEDLKHAVRAAKDNHANVYLGFAYDPSHGLYSSQQLRQEVDHQINVVDGFLSDVTT